MSEFDIFFDEYENKHNCSPEKYECFEAGVASRQAEVDSLERGYIDRKNERDELQKRIDEALKFVVDAHSDLNIGMLKMAQILKGESE